MDDLPQLNTVRENLLYCDLNSHCNTPPCTIYCNFYTESALKYHIRENIKNSRSHSWDGYSEDKQILNLQ
jgi:hypothetical protein